MVAKSSFITFIANKHIASMLPRLKSTNDVGITVYAIYVDTDGGRVSEYGPATSETELAVWPEAAIRCATTMFRCEGHKVGAVRLISMVQQDKVILCSTVIIPSEERSASRRYATLPLEMVAFVLDDDDEPQCYRRARS